MGIFKEARGEKIDLVELAMVSGTRVSGLALNDVDSLPFRRFPPPVRFFSSPEVSSRKLVLELIPTLSFGAVPSNH